MSTSPAATSDDAADKLAKEIINKFFNVANKFIQHRVLPEHTVNPFGGLKLPFAPLAAEIRTAAKLLNGTAPQPPPVTDEWFGGGQEESAPVNPPLATAPVPAQTGPVDPGCESANGDESVSLDQIMRAMNGRKVRLNQLAAELNVTAETLGQFIARPSSGLTVAGAGWVQVKA